MTPSLLFVSQHSAWLFIVVMMLLTSIASTQAQVPSSDQPWPQLNTERLRGRGSAQQQVIVSQALERFTSPLMRSLPPSLLQFDRTLTEQPEPRLDPERAV